VHNPKLNTVRVWFVALPDGSVRDVHVTPIDAQLASCLAGKLAELRLPGDRKQLLSYQLSAQPAGAEVAAEAPSRPGEFWARAEQRVTKNAKPPQSPPWWLDKNPLFVVMDASTEMRAPQLDAAAGADHAPSPAVTAPVSPTKSTDAGQAPAKTADTRPGQARAVQPQRAPQPAAASGLQPAPAAQPASEDAWWLPQQGTKH
jgi:hypothetical protein